MQNRQGMGFQRGGDGRSPIATDNYQRLQSDADRLFSLGDLYRRLARWIETNTSLNAGDINRLSAFMAMPTYEFSCRLLRARHHAAEKVKIDVANSLSDENLLQTLYYQRERLIDELQSISFAIMWPSVLNDIDNLLRFVNRLPWKEEGIASIEEFCKIVAETGVMTDVLLGKGADYGLDIDYGRYDDFVRRQKNGQFDVNDDEELVKNLMPIFYNNEEEVLRFLKEIDGMAQEDMTDLVNRWVKEKRISDYGNSRKGVLWGILNKAGLYTRSKQNWNGRVD